MKKQNSIPPKFALRFFRWFCHPDYAEDIEGDLFERYEKRIENKKNASALFVLDVLNLFRPGIIKPFIKTQELNQYDMLKNYFKIGFRSLLKYKTFSFINVFGLAVAMAIGLLIIQMLYDQRSYDQFHSKKERIYRVLSKQEKSLTPNAKSPAPLARAIEQNYPIIEESVQLIPGVGGDAVNIEDNKNTELRGFFADEGFFKVFSFDLIKGDKQNALNEPNSIIITAEKAYSLFNDRNPIGKTVHYSDRGLDHMDFGMGTESAIAPQDWGTFKVTGVINLKEYKSHIKFDALISASTLPRLQMEKFRPDHSKNWQQYSNFYTYLLLKEAGDEVELQSTIDELVTKEYAQFEHLSELSLPIQKLTDITPGEFVGGPITLRLPIQAYYFLGFLTLIILFSACLNYTNLSIARALTRAKEIGVRKVNGATRKNIIFQFLAEALITSFFALIMSNLFLIVLKFVLKGLWLSQILDLDLKSSLIVYLSFLVFSVIVGLFAGFYPAIVLSRVLPIEVLKRSNDTGSGKLGFRQILNITQFVFSMLFIITSFLIARQFEHYIDFEYGIETENVVNIPIQGNDYQLLANEFRAQPGVIEVSACEKIPSLPDILTTVVRANGEEEWISTVYHSVDANFIENMGLKLIAGENFEEASANGDNIIIDQTMMERLGYTAETEAIGNAVETGGNRSLKIIGVLQNFEFKTPVDDSNGPVIFWSKPKQFNYLNVRVSSNDWSQMMPLLEEKWSQIDPIHPFKFYVYDDQLLKSNLWMADLASIVGFIAFLAIIISCLGLLGMAVYTTERRAKEVGIRKILGATMANLTYLLSWSFVKMLFIAICIAAPISFFVNNLWLENLPNRVDFGLGTILLGSLVLLTLGMITISFQLISVSNRNPIESLKDE